MNKTCAFFDVLHLYLNKTTVFRDPYIGGFGLGDELFTYVEREAKNNFTHIYLGVATPFVSKFTV